MQQTLNMTASRIESHITLHMYLIQCRFVLVLLWNPCNTIIYKNDFLQYILKCVEKRYGD